MARMITFLGTGDYREATYELEGRRVTTRYIAHALAKMFDVHCVRVLATDAAWDKHGEDLEEALGELNVKPQRLPIPDGVTTEELWQQFQVILDAFDGEGEVVILDITHGFRAQPFFAASAMALLHAAGKLPVGLQVMYGEYERDAPVQRVWDLTLFAELLGWAQGALLLRKTGHGAALVELLERTDRQIRKEIAVKGGRDFPQTHNLVKTIEKFSEDLATIRIASLITGNDQEGGQNEQSSAQAMRKALQDYAGEVQTHLPALVPLLDTLAGMTEGLHALSLHGEAGLAAMKRLARLYVELARYPEAAIVVREGWVSSYGDEAAVEVASKSFSRKAREKAERCWRQEQGQKADAIARVRNDMQHGGFNKQPLNGAALAEQVEKLVQEFTVDAVPTDCALKKGRTWFVSRHPGAVAWLQRQGIPYDEQVQHLNIDRVEEGDTVIGTLPVNLAARVCDRGAGYLHLSLELPADLRGRELSEAELDALDARLEPYVVSLGTFNGG